MIISVDKLTAVLDREGGSSADDREEAATTIIDLLGKYHLTSSRSPQ